MGQLERYGLYVLCLVIFLILGVSIWGGGDLPSNRRGSTSANSELKLATSGALGKAETPAVGLGELEALLRPADRPRNEPKVEPKTEPKKPDGKASDASGTKGGDKPAPPPGEVVQPATPPPDVVRKTHKIQTGDNFESISRQYLGSPALRAEIGRLNARLEPTKLKPGQEILLPTAAEAQAILERSKSKPTGTAAPAPTAAPTTAAAGTYRIVKGDTLEGIAVRELGSRSRVGELKEANPGITVLKIGSVIKLPKK